MNPEEVARIRAMLRDQAGSASKGREGLFGRLRPSPPAEAPKRPFVASEDHRRSANEAAAPPPVATGAWSAMARPPEEAERVASGPARLGAKPSSPAPDTEPDVLELAEREIVAPISSIVVARAPAPDAPTFGRRDDEEIALRRPVLRPGGVGAGVQAPRPVTRTLRVAEDDGGISQASAPAGVAETPVHPEASPAASLGRPIGQDGAGIEEGGAVTNTEAEVVVASEATPDHSPEVAFDAHERHPRVETMPGPKASSGATFSVFPHLMQKLAAVDVAAVPTEAHTTCIVEGGPSGSEDVSDASRGFARDVEAFVPTPSSLLSAFMAADDLTQLPAEASPSAGTEWVVSDARVDPEEVAVEPALSPEAEAVETIEAVGLEACPRPCHAGRSDVASATTPGRAPDRMARVAAVIELRDFAQGQRPYRPGDDAAALMRDLHDVLLAERGIVDMWLTVARTGH